MHTVYARYEYALVLPLLAHAHPRAFSDSKYVWWVLVAPLAAVLVYDGVRIEWKSLIGVDSYQE